MERPKIKMLTHETIPCWYELSFRFQNNQPSLILRIHSDFVFAFPEVPQNAPIVLYEKKTFGFNDFGGILGKDFGFERSLKYLGEFSDFLEYSIPIARFEKPTGKPCSMCNGTGKREIPEGECPFCNGRGNGVFYDWHEAFSTTSSLSLLFQLLRFPETETKATIPQLLTVVTAAITGPQGSSLGGEYGLELATYLRSRPVGPIPEMIEAMKATWAKAWGGSREFDKWYFQAYTQGDKGWLNVSCPGDATGLNPDNSWIEKEIGYKFSSHNVDNPIQQLTLLASIAALHDLARATAGE